MEPLQPAVNTDANSRRAPSFFRLGTEKRAVFVLLILVGLTLMRSIVRAASRPFWHDEIYTWAITSQPSVSAIWNALRHSADANPLPYYLIERAFSRIIPNQEIAFRLPSIIGLCCILVCLFVFVRRRSGSAIALCCAAIPLITVFHDPYAVEARPSLLCAACIAVAMVCYQRAPETRWTLGMAFSLALSQSIYFYTVFMLVPFGIAESAFFLQNRRIRWVVWMALIFGFLPFIPFCPQLLNFRKYYYGTHIWSHPTLLVAGGFYGWFLHIPYKMGVGIATACVVVILSAIRFPSDRGGAHGVREETPFHEYILVLSLLALPFIILIGTWIGHGGMTERYMLPAALGIEVSASYILKRLGNPAVVLFAVFLGCGILLEDGNFWLSQFPHPGRMVSPATSLETMVDSTPYGNLPVVISDGLDYLPIAHYASPEWARRFFALIDVPASITYCGSDSVDKGFLVLRNYIPLQAYEFSTFAAEHPTFLLYSTNKTPFDWWPTRFVKEGDSVIPLVLEQGGNLYLVNLATNHDSLVGDGQ